MKNIIQFLKCPICDSDLSIQNDEYICSNGHTYTGAENFINFVTSMTDVKKVLKTLPVSDGTTPCALRKMKGFKTMN